MSDLRNNNTLRFGIAVYYFQYVFIGICFGNITEAACIAVQNVFSVFMLKIQVKPSEIVAFLSSALNNGNFVS